MHVLLIGGYGTFGFEIARFLSDEPELTLTIAGRDFEKAKAACDKLKGAATYLPLKLDRKGDLAAQIKSPIDAIIDASGPFQNYRDNQKDDNQEGDNVINYALTQGCHYLDICDDLEFVGHIHSFNKAAKDKGLIFLSGLSTYPVLTAAALRELASSMDKITSIQAGIAPSPKSVMGRSVIAAVSAYAGKKQVGVLRGGKLTHSYGLTETHRETICAPGRDPLPNILFSNVEGPDPQELPRDFKDLENIWMSAGPRPEFLHRALIGLAWAVRLNLLPHISWLTGALHKSQSLIRAGEHRGGMFVRASHGAQSYSWHMIAEGDDGPRIPAIPTVIIMRKLLRGEAIPFGARTAISDITLADFDAEFSKLEITHGIHNDQPQGSLYQQLLGSAYTEQSLQIQNLHDIGTGKSFEGRCKVTRGTNLLSHIVAAFFRFPKASPDIPVRVTLTKEGEREVWERYFNGKRMVSTQESGKGKDARLMIERFGPFAIKIAISVDGGRQILKPKGWSVFGIPLPAKLVPGGDVFEHDADGRFNFHVDMVAPLLGRLVKYEGWLEEV